MLVSSLTLVAMQPQDDMNADRTSTVASDDGGQGSYKDLDPADGDAVEVGSFRSGSPSSTSDDARLPRVCVAVGDEEMLDEVDDRSSTPDQGMPVIRLRRLPVDPELVRQAKNFYTLLPETPSLRIFFDALQKLKNEDIVLYNYTVTDGIEAEFGPFLARTNRLQRFLDSVGYKDTWMIREFIIETFNDHSEEDYALLIEELRKAELIQGEIAAEINNIAAFVARRLERKRQR